MPSQDQEHEKKNEEGGPPGARPQVIGTDDPAIATGSAPSPDWASGPDRPMVIETNRITESNGGANTKLVMVSVPTPIPSAPPRGDSGEPKEKPKNKGDETANQKDKDKKHTTQGPSLTKILLYAGLVALVCGVAGAWAYSHFFGSSHGKEAKSSKKEEEIQKQAEAQKKESESRVRQAESAWMTAVKELHQTQAAERSAWQSQAETKAILDFFQSTLLSAGRTSESTLEQAFQTFGQGKAITLHDALDLTEKRVAEAFTDRPLAEATVRAALGRAYLNLGDAESAIPQYERALALREGLEGPNQTDTSDCRNELAVAYRLAGRTTEAARLFERNPSSPTHASALAVRGATLLLEGKPAEAELKLRECLAIRRKSEPNDWTTFDTQSLLGQALSEQGKYTEAEPLLRSGYEGLKQHRDAIPPHAKPRLTKALKRLVQLYEAWGKDAEAARWRKELPDQ
jgi:tetratricopeptide (TPR) repeat protein